MAETTCVPFAISLVTGSPLELVNAILKPFQRKGWVDIDSTGRMAVSLEGVLTAFRALGYKTFWYYNKTDEPKTVADWVDLANRNFPGESLIIFSYEHEHCVVFHEGFLLDQHWDGGCDPEEHPAFNHAAEYALRVKPFNAIS